MLYRMARVSKKTISDRPFIYTENTNFSMINVPEQGCAVLVLKVNHYVYHISTGQFFTPLLGPV